MSRAPVVLTLVRALVACEASVAANPALAAQVRAAIAQAQEDERDDECPHCQRHLDDCNEERCEGATYARLCDEADSANECRQMSDEGVPF